MFLTVSSCLAWRKENGVILGSNVSVFFQQESLAACVCSSIRETDLRRVPATFLNNLHTLLLSLMNNSYHPAARTSSQSSVVAVRSVLYVILFLASNKLQVFEYKAWSDRWDNAALVGLNFQDSYVTFWRGFLLFSFTSVSIFSLHSEWYCYGFPSDYVCIVFRNNCNTPSICNNVL